MSNNWGKLTSALRKADALSPEATVTDAVEAAKAYPIRVRVTRSYNTDEGWRVAGNDDTEKEYIEAGFMVRNWVVNIMPYTDG